MKEVNLWGRMCWAVGTNVFDSSVEKPPIPLAGVSIRYKRTLVSNVGYRVSNREYRTRSIEYLLSRTNEKTITEVCLRTKMSCYKGPNSLSVQGDSSVLIKLATE